MMYHNQPCYLLGVLKGQTVFMPPFFPLSLSLSLWVFLPSKAVLRSAHPCSDVKLSCTWGWKEKLSPLIRLDSLCNRFLYNNDLKIYVTGAPRAIQSRVFMSDWGTLVQTPRRVHGHSVAPPEICLLWRCWAWLITMQFCRKVLCQPCSARVTSPEEDMEYKMGSCIGISHSQVNSGDGVLSSISGENIGEDMEQILLLSSWMFVWEETEGEGVLCSVGGGATSAGRRSGGDGEQSVR